MSVIFRAAVRAAIWSRLGVELCFTTAVVALGLEVLDNLEAERLEDVVGGILEKPVRSFILKRWGNAS